MSNSALINASVLDFKFNYSKMFKFFHFTKNADNSCDKLLLNSNKASKIVDIFTIFYKSMFDFNTRLVLTLHYFHFGKLFILPLH